MWVPEARGPSGTLCVTPWHKDMSMHACPLLTHVPPVPFTSLTKHKFKGKIVKNLQTATELVTRCSVPRRPGVTASITSL